MAKTGWGALVPVLFLADLVSLVLSWRWLRDSGRGGVEALFLVLVYCLFAVFVGIWVIRFAGGLSLRTAMQKVAANEAPDDHLIHALLALVGGILIITPGLVSDVLGLALVLPFTRWAPRLVMRRVFARRHERELARPLEVDDYRVE